MSELLKKNINHKIGIVGAGKAGCHALYLLKEIPNVEILGIVDQDPTAPGIKRAHLMDLPVYENYNKLLKKKPDIVLELTGKKQVYEDLLKVCGKDTEVIFGPTVKIFFDLLESIRYQEDKLNKIVRISKLISKVGKYKSLVSQLVNEIAACLDVELAGFLLYDPETDELVAQKPAYGVIDESLIEKYRIPLSFDTQIRDVFISRKPYLSNAPYEDEKTLKSVLDMFGARNVMSVALVAEDEALGVLHVANKRTGDFNQNDLDLLSSLSGHVSIIIHNANLHKREQERFKELSSLLQSSRSLTSTQTYQEVLDTVAEQANIMMNAKFGAVLLLDDSGKHLKIVAGHKLSKSYIKALNENIIVKVGEGTSGIAVEKKQPVWLFNVFKDTTYEPWKKVAETEGYKSIISLPLIYHDKAFGAISLYFPHPRNFREKEVNLLMTMINDAAIAIENARVVEQDKINQQRMKVVHETSLNLMAMLEPEKIFKKICPTLTKKLNYDRVILFLFNNEGDLEAAHWAGIEENELKKLLLSFDTFSPVHKSIWQSKYVNQIKSGRAIKEHLTRNDHSEYFASIPIVSRIDLKTQDNVNCTTKFKEGAYCWAEMYQKFQDKSQDFSDQLKLCVTCSKFKVIGELVIDNSQNETKINDQDIIALDILAQNITTALDNAMLHKHLEHMAITDSLTELYNRGYFHEYFSKELNRAKRFNQFLSLILLDLDNFKYFNDEFGHRKGDSLLKMVAKIIKSNVREFDIACRYGGDEFAIILPEANQAKAAKVSDRIVRAISNASAKEKTATNITLSASIGISTYPTSAEDIDGLIDSADSSLYEQKGLRRLEPEGVR